MSNEPNQGSDPEEIREPMPTAPDSSLMGQLRKMREEAKGDKYLDLDIPGYKGLLVARFRPYPVSKSEPKAEAIRKKMESKRPVILDASCDNLIDACAEILVRADPEKDLSPIDDEVPVLFDSRLAKFLGIEGVTSARQVVVGVYPTEQAILAASNTVSEWLADTTRDSDEDLLGE